MGRLRANFARLGNPMQDCHLRKEPDIVPRNVSPTYDGQHGAGGFLDSASDPRNDSAFARQSDN